MRHDQARGLIGAAKHRPRAPRDPRDPSDGATGDESIRTPGDVLGLVSGKGGVGKTALAVNLAAAASQQGRRTLLIDGDVGLTNADLLLGVVPRFDLLDWVEGRVGLEQLVCTSPGGVELLLGGRGVASHERLCSALRGLEAMGLERLIADYELVVVDLGAGIGSPLIELASACQRVWLVAMPEPTSLADAYATTKQLTERAPDLLLELVVNRMADRASGERTHQALERMTRRFLSRGLPLRGLLPEDAALARSVARQSPVVLSEPGSAIARRLSLLAESLADAGSGAPRGRGARPGVDALLAS